MHLQKQVSYDTMFLSFPFKVSLSIKIKSQIVNLKQKRVNTHLSCCPHCQNITMSENLPRKVLWETDSCKSVNSLGGAPPQCSVVPHTNLNTTIGRRGYVEVTRRDQWVLQRAKETNISGSIGFSADDFCWLEWSSGSTGSRFAGWPVWIFFTDRSRLYLQSWYFSYQMDTGVLQHPVAVNIYLRRGEVVPLYFSACPTFLEIPIKEKKLGVGTWQQHSDIATKDLDSYGYPVYAEICQHTQDWNASFGWA